MVEYLNNAEQLKIIFDIDKISDRYTNYTPLIDRKVGFSVKREYPDHISYKPPKTEDGNPDTVALIYVVYGYPSETKEKINSSKIKLYLNITPYSKYLANHFDYDFNDDKTCPTKKSVQESKLTPKPIALETFDEYLYDHDTGKLQNSNGNELTGEKILDKFFREHCDTVHLFKGLTLRWKIGSRNGIVKLCDFLVQIGKWKLKVFFGRTFESKDPFSGTLKVYQKKDMRLLQTESIDVFGYKASKNVIVTFSFLVLLVYSIAYKLGLSSIYLKKMAENNLAVICLAIVTLWTLDHVLPILGLFFINLSIRLKLRLIFMKFKV